MMARLAVIRRRLAGRTDLCVASVLLVIVGLCALAPSVVVGLAPGSPSPTACSLRASDGSYQDRLPPSSEHWFGMDAQGCDQFSRVVYGARHSLLVGVAAAGLSALLGMLLGVAAGWRGGWVDSVVRRVGDVVLGVPLVVGLILLLSVVVSGQRSAAAIVATFAALVWPVLARITRAATRAIRGESYIEAARAMGASDLWICARHVVPNALPAVVAFSTSLVGLLIAAEATLSYLGVGVDSSVISWGKMMDVAQPYYQTSPHLLIFPGLFLAATVAGFLLVGDSLARGTTPVGRSR